MKPDPAAIRKHLGLTQSRFAQLVGVHPMTVSKWERGILQPNRRQLEVLRAVGAATRGDAPSQGVSELLGILNQAFVDVGEFNGMKLSASNQLKGKIIQLEKGPISARVVIEIVPKVNITSVITTASVNRLGLKVGKTVVAIIKATEVIVGTY